MCADKCADAVDWLLIMDSLIIVTFLSPVYTHSQGRGTPIEVECRFSVVCSAALNVDCLRKLRFSVQTENTLQLCRRFQCTWSGYFECTLQLQLPCVVSGGSAIPWICTPLWSGHSQILFEKTYFKFFHLKQQTEVVCALYDRGTSSVVHISLSAEDPKFKIHCTHARTNWHPNNAFHCRAPATKVRFWC